MKVSKVMGLAPTHLVSSGFPLLDHPGYPISGNIHMNIYVYIYKYIVIQLYKYNDYIYISCLSQDCSNFTATLVAQEDMWLESVSTWPRGSLPTPEMLANLLRAEQAQDVSIIDAGSDGWRS